MHSRFGRGVVMGYQGSHVTVLFDDVGEKLIDAKMAVERGLLQSANRR